VTRFSPGAEWGWLVVLLLLDVLLWAAIVVVSVMAWHALARMPL
jgi:hypothetical protein